MDSISDRMSAVIFLTMSVLLSSLSVDAVADVEDCEAAANSSAEMTPSPFLSRLESGD